MSSWARRAATSGVSSSAAMGWGRLGLDRTLREAKDRLGDRRDRGRRRRLRLGLGDDRLRLGLGDDGLRLGLGDDGLRLGLGDDRLRLELESASSATTRRWLRLGRDRDGLLVELGPRPAPSGDRPRAPRRQRPPRRRMPRGLGLGLRDGGGLGGLELGCRRAASSAARASASMFAATWSACSLVSYTNPSAPTKPPIVAAISSASYVGPGGAPVHAPGVVAHESSTWPFVAAASSGRSEVGHASGSSRRSRMSSSLSSVSATASAGGARDAARRSARSSVPGTGTQLQQPAASSFQQLTQVYWRQSMQKLKDSWKASSCAVASAPSSVRIASSNASPSASWLVR